MNVPVHQRSVLHHLHDGHPFEAWARIRLQLEPEALGDSEAPRLVRGIIFGSAVVMAALVSVDLTIVNVALPAIVGDLGGGITTVQWVASVYSLTYAVVLLPAGRLGDAFGHRRMFISGSFVYCVGSLVAALAPTAFVVIAARAVQGVGAAMLAPTVTALIARVFPPRRRDVTLGISAGVLAVASGLGPLVGGALTDAFGWRWVFGIGVVLPPLPLLGMAIVPAAVDRRTAVGFRPDLVAVALFAVAAGGVQLALIESRSLGWWPAAALLLAVSMVAGVALERHDRTRDDGLLDARLFRSRVMNGALVATFASCFGYYGMLVYVVLYLESVMGLTPFEVGLVMFGPAVVSVVASPVVGKVLNPATTRPLIVVGLVFLGGGILLVANIDSTSSLTANVLPGLLLNALGYSMVSVPAKVAPLDDVADELYGRVAALTGTAGKLAAGIGVAISAALFHTFSARSAESVISSRDLRPPLTVARAEHCIGVDDVHACVAKLSDHVSALAAIRAKVVDAVVAIFDGAFSGTLATVGSVTIVCAAVVWFLLARIATRDATSIAGDN